ncbi:MAG TPA: hypothetical protein VGF80_08015, partial [Galbitalea sp.]
WRQYREYGRFRARTARRHPISMRRSHLIAPALVANVALAATPGHAGGIARRMCGLYAAVLATAAVRAGRRSHAWSDAALVPAVLAAMHIAHGIGLLDGAASDGVPWAALARVFGQEGLTALLEPQPDAVFAPSLDAASGS